MENIKAEAYPPNAIVQDWVHAATNKLQHVVMKVMGSLKPWNIFYSDTSRNLLTHVVWL